MVDALVHRLPIDASQLLLVTNGDPERQPTNDRLAGLPAGVTLHMDTFPNPLLSPGPAGMVAGAFRYLGAARRLFVVFRQRPPRVVHLHFVSSDVFLLLLYKLIFRYRLVVTFHGSDLHVASRSVLARIKIRLAVRYADAVTAVSRPMADCLRDRFHATAVKCIPNGVDTTIGSDADQHCPPGVQPDHFVFVGRLHPTKRVPLLVETYKACVDAGCDRNLYIIGDGEDRDVVARLIETYELRDRIVLVGAMSHREALAAVASARCVVLFSSHEGCPTVVLESMAAGVPVVATCAGGIPDLVADRDTGFLFPADQPQQAIGSMLYLAHHPLEARDMGRRAREVARNRFELADTIQQYMALYERFNDSAATTPVR